MKRNRGIIKNFRGFYGEISHKKYFFLSPFFPHENFVDINVLKCEFLFGF